MRRTDTSAKRVHNGAWDMGQGRTGLNIAPKLIIFYFLMLLQVGMPADWRLSLRGPKLYILETDRNSLAQPSKILVMDKIKQTDVHADENLNSMRT